MDSCLGQGLGGLLGLAEHRGALGPLGPLPQPLSDNTGPPRGPQAHPSLHRCWLPRGRRCAAGRRAPRGSTAAVTAPRRGGCACERIHHQGKWGLRNPKAPGEGLGS